MGGDQEQPVKFEMVLKEKDVQNCQLGLHFVMNQLINKLEPEMKAIALKKDRFDKWMKMIGYGLDADLQDKVVQGNKNKLYSATDPKPIKFTNYAKIGLQNYFENNPEIFLSRLAKGPPPQFRWFAWRFIASRLKSKTIGAYDKLVAKGRSPGENPWAHDIFKDIDRTFPEHPYFNRSEFGSFGQGQLKNVLEAYSIANPNVGYCQSMNFMAGFILMVSGADEE